MRRDVVFLHVSLVSVVATTTTTTTTTVGVGAPSCPCMTFAEGMSDSLAYNVSGMTRSISQLTRATRMSYGIGCARHDAAPPYFMSKCDTGTAKQPGFCTDSWCYVKSDCPLHSTYSDFRLGRKYSYATCGYLDRYKTFRADRALEGQEINIAQIHNSGGWKGSYCKRGHSSCVGSVVEMVHHVIFKAGATANVTTTFYGGPLGNYPRAYPEQVMYQVYRQNPKQKSTFTACVYAVGMGYVDICIGAFTCSPARELVAGRCIPLYDEPIYLVTNALENDEDVWDYLTKAFKPFQPRVWLALFASIMGMSWLLALLERGEGGEYAHKSVLSALKDASFRGLQSFFDAASAFTPKRGSGRYVNLTIGFLMLITIAAYTANLAAFILLKPQDVALISSWDEVLADPSIKVCTLWTYATKLTEALKLPENQVVEFLSRSDVLKNVGTSTCDAAAISLEDVQKGRKTGDLPCNKMMVGQPLFVQNWFFPVSDRVAKTIMTHVLAAKNEGHWLTSLNRYKPPDPCLELQNDDEEESETTGMALSDMSGPFLICVVLCIIAIFYDLCHRETKKVIKKRSSTDLSVDPVDEIVAQFKIEQELHNSQVVDALVKRVKRAAMKGQNAMRSDEGGDADADAETVDANIAGLAPDQSNVAESDPIVEGTSGSIDNPVGESDLTPLDEPLENPSHWRSKPVNNTDKIALASIGETSRGPPRLTTV